MRKFVLGASAALTVAAAHAAAAPPAPIVPAMPSDREVVTAQGAAPITPAQGAAPIESIGGTPIDMGAPVAGAADVLTGTSSGGGRSGSRMYVEGSYLLLWANDGNTPAVPIATGGPSLGVMGGNGTTTLLGGTGVDYGAMNGFKIAVGSFLGDSRMGVELNGLYVGRKSVTDTTGPSSTTTIARPFYDTSINQQNSVVVAAPGAFNGGVSMTNSLEIFSGEVNPFFRVVDGGAATVDLITGFRYFQRAETLNIYAGSALQPGGVSAFNGYGLAAPASILVHDRFGALTTFYGGNLGAKVSFGRNRVFLDLTGKVAIGGVSQRVSVDGSTTVVSGGGFVAPAATQGGFLTAGGNLGQRTDTRFAVLPEGNAQLGFQVTSWANVFAGFTVIYLDTAARPAEQINTNFPVTSLPTSPNYARPTGQNTTAIVNDDFFLYGFNFGVTLTF